MTIDINEKIKKLIIEKRAFINGQFIESKSGEIISKTSSANGCDISGLPACSKEDVDLAVGAAKKAYDEKTWVNTPSNVKKEVMFKLADLMEENREELALLDTLETGRAFKNYYYDSIPKAIEAMRYFAEAVDKVYDYAMPPSAESFATITREPLGVVGLITPWNDPLVVSTWKFAPALLMGNSIVVKPAEQSSFSILKVAELAKKAGLPDGTFNVIPGYGEIAGKALALHNDVSGVFFTGSSVIGKQILQYAGQSNMKKVGLECGGKSAFVITNNCKSIEKAAEVLAKNIFYNQGQICSGPSRVLVAKELKQKLIDLLKLEIDKYSPCDPFDINSEVGCVVSREQKDKIDKYIEEGVASGASIISAKASDWFLKKDRMAVLPVIFDNVMLDSSIVKEEIFGPVLTVISFDSPQEALMKANDSIFGLAASIWSNDIDEVYYFTRGLQAGIVHVNSYGDDDNTAPFGGFKQSGIGKDKSVFAFDEYSHLKTTWYKLSSI